MLDCEFTVMAGPYVRRKFWQNFTVAGGKLDDKGQSKGWNISKSAFRAMVDSALGLDPKDESAAAKQKRVIQGLKQLDGIVFAARIMVEPASTRNTATKTSSPTWSCPASRNMPRSCAAKPCSPSPSTPSREKPRTTPRCSHRRGRRDRHRPPDQRDGRCALGRVSQPIRRKAPAAGPAWLNN